ncbi:MAG: cobalamin-independent methionine synthase II family protein [Firmicutes bacterium]|nr:cobalamin-independent methionine synthase II family protein [Alicyclobacillaceae bacterium]MCL6497368.1 cobalamin-independent methionine synthase II family protein [Bacillota bacterium]
MPRVARAPFFCAPVGSWPRPPALVRALRERRQGRMDDETFGRLADEAVRAAVAAQEAAGIDVVTDGEQRRDNFLAFVAEKLDGVAMMTVAELLPHLEDKAAFEEVLGTLDVPAFALTNPVATGPIRRRKPLAGDEVAYLGTLTQRPIKVALPGPYLLTRAMWVEALSRHAYPDRESLAEDVVRILREEIAELKARGVAIVQLDEPVFTEVVFTQRHAHRTFMCGALTQRMEAEQELAWAVDLVNRTVSGLTGDDTWLAVHICRGNWSTQEDLLLSGAWDPLVPYLEALAVDQLVLECATERAGSLETLKALPQHLGIGVVNPRTPQVERPESIVERIARLTDAVPPERIALNPDCGFGTFAQRPMNGPEVAQAKLAAMAAARDTLRARWA